MIRSFCKVLRFCAVLLLGLSSALYANLDISQFQTYVDSVIPGARYGMSIRSVRTGMELASIRGKERFTPASTLKTLTTATALHFLPLDYSPRTIMQLNGSVKKKVFVGNISIRGEGDPNISGRYYADPFHVFYDMMDSLRMLGIDTIRGKIALDTAYYKGPWKAAHWRKSYYDAWYGAEIAPLGFNDNCVVVRLKPGANVGDPGVVSVVPDVGYVQIHNKLVTGKKKKRKWTYGLEPDKPIITIGGEIGIGVDSAQLVLPVRNPVAFFRAAFLYALKEEGIVFQENLVIPKGIEIQKFEFSSAPLLSVLDEINQRSQNLHAETLFRNMAAQVMGEGSVEAGKKAERKFLSEIGINPDDFEVWDGCGLSPKNKVKPTIETKLLRAMARHPKGAYYINSFAGPRVGTGSKRMLDLQAPWLTKFKTGFIGEAHALAGYIFTMDGDTLSVAMYLNETGRNSDALCKNVLDTLWLRIVDETNANYTSLMEMKNWWLAAQNVVGLHARLDYFSKALKGKPYLLGPMGEGYLDSIEHKPLVNMDSVDCMTYVEHVLALALASDEDSVFSKLQQIRYLDGKISYMTRKHYMLLDWVGEGRFAKVIPMQGDTVVERVIPKSEFFKEKKLKYTVGGKSVPNPRMRLRYLPYSKAIEFAKKPYEGPAMVAGIAFVAKSDKLDATHTGFVILHGGEKPVLRHASSLKKKVVEQPLLEYLHSRKGKLPGITLFEFKAN